MWIQGWHSTVKMKARVKVYFWVYRNETAQIHALLWTINPGYAGEPPNSIYLATECQHDRLICVCLISKTWNSSRWQDGKSIDASATVDLCGPLDAVNNTSWALGRCHTEKPYRFKQVRKPEMETSDWIQDDTSAFRKGASMTSIRGWTLVTWILFFPKHCITWYRTHAEITYEKNCSATCKRRGWYRYTNPVITFTCLAET